MYVHFLNVTFNIGCLPGGAAYCNRSAHHKNDTTGKCLLKRHPYSVEGEHKNESL